MRSIKFILWSFSSSCCCNEDKNSLDDDYLPKSLVNIVQEPCIICDGNGTYDIVKSVDEEVESWTEVCSDKIDDITSQMFYWSLPSVGECKELEEICVVCHNRTTN